jgi:hypothetical protein
VQIDGSEHAWFEDRGPPCTLLAFVDDATSRLMQLRFVTSESVNAGEKMHQRAGVKLHHGGMPDVPHGKAFAARQTG